VKYYLSQLTSPSSALLGPWKPHPVATDHQLQLQSNQSQQKHRPTDTTAQLLHNSSTTYEEAIDFPAMRLVNIATKKSRPIQTIEI
jgi:hypothetical protein